ncbi:MAG: hypothetical protein GXO92_01435 [FCB group bacterium]|nr:hypothetical protein [FCB group bacterium]
MTVRMTIYGLLLTTLIFGRENPAVVKVGEPVILIEEETAYIAPRWSPDGNTIAFTGNKYQGIYLFSFDQATIITLSEDPGAGFGMAWSHDGKSISAVISKYENRRRYNALAVFDVRSGTKTLISKFTTILPGVPRWTRDDRFLYLDGTNQFRLFPRGGNTRALPQTDEKILFISQGKIRQWNAANQTEDITVSVPGEVLALTVSPDRKKIAFEILGGNLWIADADGRNAIDLGPGHEPSWHPRSDKLAYMRTTDDGHRILSSDIFVVNADGSGKINLTETPDIIEMRPDWSPDGRWIIYDTYDRGTIMMLEVR